MSFIFQRALTAGSLNRLEIVFWEVFITKIGLCSKTLHPTLLTSALKRDSCPPSVGHTVD